VKPPTARLDAFVARPDPGIRALVIYGPDQGLVRERGMAACRAVVPDLKDPFRIAELAPARLAQDPALLADEMAAIPLTGGRRLVRIRGADDGVAPSLAAVLKAPPPGDALVVIEAGDLSKGAKLRGLAETAAAAAAIPCYVEDEPALAATIAAQAREAGFGITPDARALLAACLVGDRLIARGEIDKLITYMGPPGGKAAAIDLTDVEACIGDSGQLGLDAAAWSAADGDFKALDRGLTRLFADGEAAVAILRAAQRHFQRLHLAAALVARGETTDRVMDQMKPPVFFRERTRFARQMQLWGANALRQALDRLTETEADCKRTGMPDITLCSRALFQIAALCRRDKRAAAGASRPRAS
jgi:DNA polymerase-3 subunit delta